MQGVPHGPSSCSSPGQPVPPARQSGAPFASFLRCQSIQDWDFAHTVSLPKCPPCFHLSKRFNSTSTSTLEVFFENQDNILNHQVPRLLCKAKTYPDGSKSLAGISWDSTILSKQRAPWELARASPQGPLLCPVWPGHPAALPVCAVLSKNYVHVTDRLCQKPQPSSWLSFCYPRACQRNIFIAIF